MLVFLKLAFRNLMKNKGYSFLNIAGLAVGLSTCLAIMIFVAYERSYDHYHPKAERVMRIEPRYLNPDGSAQNGYCELAPGFVPYLKEGLPGIEQIAKLLAYKEFGDTYVKLGNQVFKENRVFMADAALLDVLSIPLAAGDPRTALADPNALLISESTARRYFGAGPVLGQMLTISNARIGDNLLRITGVMKDTPANSHVHFDFLGSLATLGSDPDSREYLFGKRNLSDNVTYVYARLAEGVAPAALERQMTVFLDRVLPSQTDRDGNAVRFSAGTKLVFQPIQDIHLDGRQPDELENNAERRDLTIFSLIALFILIIACINFVNLSTARASQRAREVGLRKVVGVSRRLLTLQFLAESALVVTLGMLLALALTLLTLPVFSALAGRDLSLGAMLTPATLIQIGLVYLFTSVAAGLYPACYLSAFKPTAILRGEVTRGAGGTFLRKALVVFQFAISAGLLVGVGVAWRQVNYLGSADLGFDRENVVLLPADAELIRNWPSFRQRLIASSLIRDAALSKRSPSSTLQDSPGFQAEVNGKTVNTPFEMPHNRVSHEFFHTYGIRLVAGRDFSPEYPTDATESYIINETAAQRLGFRNPAEAVGQSITANPDVPGRIIGVSADFNYETMRNEIKPILTYVRLRAVNTLSVRIAPGNPQRALAHIKSVLAAFRPNYPFEYDFLDSRLKTLYQNDERTLKMFAAFGGLAIVVACLGLVGLGSFMAEQRTREIGIRKILGASVPGLIARFAREFAKWVLVANLVAAPVAYWLMSRWLSSFAYRVGLDWQLFVTAGGLTLGVALLAVFTQSWRAAAANPVEALRRQ